MPYTPRIPANVRRLVKNAQQNAAIEQQKEDQMFDLEMRRKQVLLEDAQFETEVVNPAREREMRMQQRMMRDGYKRSAYENEIAMRQMENEWNSYEESSTIRNTFYGMAPEEREENRETFVRDARKLFERNPNEHTRATFLQFAQHDISREIQDTLSPPEIEGDTAPGANYRDNMERLKNLKRKYQAYPELHGAIEAAMEQETNKPQNWASQFDAYFEELPKGTQRILNKAKAGNVISGIERTLAENSLNRLFETRTGRTSTRMPSADIFNRYYDPQMPEGYRQSVRSAYPNIQWGELSKPDVGPAPKIEDQTVVEEPANRALPTPPTKAQPATRESAKDRAVNFLQEAGVIDMESSAVPVGELQRMGGMIQDSVTTSIGEERLKEIEQEIARLEKDLDNGVPGSASKLNRLYKEQDLWMGGGKESLVESVARAPGRVESGALRVARDTGLIKFLANLTGDKRYDKEGNIKPVYWDRETGKLKQVPDSEVKEGYGLIYMEDDDGNLTPWADDEILERREQEKG